MNKLITTGITSLLVAVSSHAIAGSKHEHDHGKASTATAAKTGTATTDMADGEVRKIDKEAGKVTLKHGEIKSLEMPPMTMVFRVKDPSMLDQLKVGDKIKFQAEQIKGAYTITKTEAAK